MSLNSVRKTGFFGGFLLAQTVVLLVFAQAASAQDLIVTRDQRYSGQVLSANTNGVVIRLPAGQQFQIPRGLILELKVAQPAMAEKGIMYYERGSMREAVANLARAMPQFEALDTDWARKAVLYYARSSLATKDYATAAKMFNAFMAWYPDSPDMADAAIGLVEIDMHQGKHESALAKFTDMAGQYDSQVKPDAAGFRQAALVYLGIGQCYEKLGNKDKALHAYLTVIALYPEKACVDDALFGAGRMCVALGRLDKADALFAELVNDHPASEFARDAIKEQSLIRQKKAEAGAAAKKTAGQ